jgi:hypothetical protein
MRRTRILTLVLASVLVLGITLLGKPAHAITCGDGVTESPETCDDGNTVSGDGL